MNICLAVPDINTAQIDRVRKIAHSDTLLLRSDFSSQSAPEPGFLNSEVVFGNVPPHWLEHTETLRWAQLESVGFGEYRDLDWKSLSRRITLTNLAGFFADPVAQTALAGILSLYRGLDNFTLLRSQKKLAGKSSTLNLAKPFPEHCPAGWLRHDQSPSGRTTQTLSLRNKHFSNFRPARCP